jgi:hypothetical protein
MMKRFSSSRFFSSFMIAAAATLLFSGSARAQLSDGYDPLERNTVKLGLRHFMVSLARPAKGKEGDFIIRMTDLFGHSGCPKIGEVPYQTDFQDTILNVQTGHFKVDFNNLPLHPEYECSGKTVYPAANIPLSVGMLKEKGTSKIRFQTNVQSAYPGMASDDYDISEPDYFDVVYGDHFIQLSPEKPQIVDIPRYLPNVTMDNVKNPLKLWFYPKGTVILRASGAPKGADLRAALDSLARAHSLVPLDSIIKDFTSPIDDPDSFYYVDKSKKQFLANKEGIKDGIPLDVIHMPATVYGADGDESTEQPIQVFAHTPYSYE